MGSIYSCTCKKCGLTGEVSGGSDVGFDVKTQTAYCENCRALIDYVTEVWSDPGDGGEILVNVCPSCKESLLIDWNGGEPCPKCKGELVIGELVMDWD